MSPESPREKRQEAPSQRRRSVIVALGLACFVAALLVLETTLRLPRVQSTVVTERTDYPGPPPTAAPSPRQAPPPSVTQQAAPTDPQQSDDGAADDAQLLIAETLLKNGDEKAAAAIYKKLLQSGPRRGVAAQRLGMLYTKQGEYALAGEMYRESARILRESRP